jgi:DNA-binding MarR family transcriptional regulator
VITPDSPSTQYIVPSLNEISAPADNARTKPLLDLFAQVTALAIRLKQRVDLPHAEHTVLEIIDRFGPITVPQIARTRSTSRQNIQILVDRLEAIGRIELSGNPAHKKSALVRLTEKGKVSLEASESAQKDLLQELGSRLSEAEVRGATAVLSKVRGLLSTDQQETANSNQSFHPGRAAKRIDPPKLSPVNETEPQAEEFPINLL